MPSNPNKKKVICGVEFRYDSTNTDWQSKVLYNCTDADLDKIEGIFSYQTDVSKRTWFEKLLSPNIPDDQIRVSWNCLNMHLNDSANRATECRIALAALLLTNVLTTSQHDVWAVQYGNINMPIEVPGESFTLFFNK